MHPFARKFAARKSAQVANRSLVSLNPGLAFAHPGLVSYAPSGLESVIGNESHAQIVPLRTKVLRKPPSPRWNHPSPLGAFRRGEGGEVTRGHRDRHAIEKSQAFNGTIAKPNFFSGRRLQRMAQAPLNFKS